jgi:general secretion pathway protein C
VRQAGTPDNAALLRQYRDALINQPQSLMNLVNATPVTEKGSGKLKGYRIRPGKDRKLLGRFGLKSGDVVTSVNGVALDNPIKALEIMRDLSTATSVTLDVERNGVTESFAFQVD